MAITKEKKDEIFSKLTSAVNDSQSMVFVNFRGLSVSETTKLRKELRNEGVQYAVAKKTLVKRALDESKLKGEIPPLDGELALAYGDDLIAPARGVYEFQKKYKDNIAIIGGVFDGKYMSQAEMLEVATIPPIPQLRGMFLNVINSPIQGLAIVLNQVAEKKAA